MNSIRIKQSAGLACCRYKNELEVLLVKKRYSYGLYAFVMGNYNIHDNNLLSNIFNNMTVSEKIDVLKFQFSTLWYRIWGYVPVDPPDFNIHSLAAMDRLWKFLYKKHKVTSSNIFKSRLAKFNSLIYTNTDLKSIILKSKSVELTWELPKGRIEKGETLIQATVREFQEETGSPVNDYYIINDLPTIETKFISDGVIYNHIYFTAFTNKIKDDCVYTLSPEIECIKWCNIVDVISKPCNPREDLADIVSKVFKSFNENFIIFKN